MGQSNTLRFRAQNLVRKTDIAPVILIERISYKELEDGERQKPSVRWYRCSSFRKIKGKWLELVPGKGDFTELRPRLLRRGCWAVCWHNEASYMNGEKKESKTPCQAQ